MCKSWKANPLECEGKPKKGGKCLTLALTASALANNNDDNDKKVRASEAGSEGEPN